MESNLETTGSRLSRFKFMGLPVNLGVKVVAIQIEMPASNTNNRIFVRSINNLHVANSKIATEANSLFVEVES